MEGQADWRRHSVAIRASPLKALQIRLLLFPLDHSWSENLSEPEAEPGLVYMGQETNVEGVP